MQVENSRPHEISTSHTINRIWNKIKCNKLYFKYFVTLTVDSQICLSALLDQIFAVVFLWRIKTANWFFRKYSNNNIFPLYHYTAFRIILWHLYIMFQEVGSLHPPPPKKRTNNIEMVDLGIIRDGWDTGL